MQQKTRQFKQLTLVYLLTAAVIGFYSWVTITAPVDQTTLDKYNISATQLKLLLVTIVVPLIFIWASAVFGYASFKRYALIIKKTADGQGVLKIANGLGLLALQLILTSLIRAVFGARGEENSLLSANTVTTINAYLSIALTLGAYYLIFQGGRELKKLVGSKQKPLAGWQLGTYGLLAAAYVLFSVLHKLGPAPDETRAIIDILPLPLLLVTYVLPFLVIWYLGLSGALSLRQYQLKVPGVIYKQIFGGLATGIYVIIVASMFSQFLGAFSSQFEGASLAPILIILYSLIAVIAAGFLYVASSARKLRKIEEV